MVGHEHASVRRGAGETGVAQQPRANEVIHRLVAEEQSMCGFVHERQELGMCPTHQDEGCDPRNRMGDPQCCSEDSDGLGVETHHAECVASVGDSPQRFAKCRSGSPVGLNECIASGRNEVDCGRRHTPQDKTRSLCHGAIIAHREMPGMVGKIAGSSLVP
jgi:hypothetical protein